MCLVCLSPKAQTDKGSLHLFPDSVKATAGTVVCNFLERYLYYVRQSERGYDFFQRMADDKVMLREGSFDNINKLNSDCLFSIQRFEHKGYEVQWTDISGNILLSLQFPVKYELLLGMPKAEIEKTMRSQLTACTAAVHLWPKDSVLRAIGDGYRCSSVTECYYVDSLNTTTYYEEDAQGVTHPVFANKNKGYSAANLMLGIISDAAAYKLHIEQNLYGFRTDSYILPLTKWLNYCLENKLKVFFGIEEERTDGLKALLIAKNEELGYCHMMTVILPDDFISKRDAVLRAVLNAYIPLDNLENLYYTQPSKTPRK